jgi:hypothetical protein
MKLSNLQKSKKSKLTLPGNPNSEGSKWLTSLYILFVLADSYIENIIYIFTKQATLMRRSTVLTLPLQLVFPAYFNTEFLTAVNIFIVKAPPTSFSISL